MGCRRLSSDPSIVPDGEKSPSGTDRPDLLARSATNSAPLVVNLDGTLTPTNTLVESILKLVKTRPLLALRLPFLRLRGRAPFTTFVTTHASVSPTHLPYREALLAYLAEEKTRGRRLILATASHRDTAEAVAAHLQLFSRVLAMDGEHNLNGARKLEAIRASIGHTFVYAGDSRADLPIWKSAVAAVVVDASASVTRALSGQVRIERTFPGERAGLMVWFRALRVQQWLKNLLVFVPMLTAFSFGDPSMLIAMAVAFTSFCLVASATYIVNDLWDLDSDRVHPRKKYRPFASARISVLRGLAVAACMLAAAFGLAAALPPAFLLTLFSYLVITSLYTWLLKKLVLLDVLALSFLYTLRIVAGAVAIGVVVSQWLLAFSVFIFFSLSLVKRCSELVSAGAVGQAGSPGRDYRAGDLAVLWPLGVGASLCALVIFGLFISAEETQLRYGTPELLWIAAIGLLYWLSRLWIVSSRGEMHDDPLVFAVRDLNSRITIAVMIGITLAARFVVVDLT